MLTQVALLSIKKLLTLALISPIAIMLQGCIPGSQICYIPPASSKMPKAQLLHVSQSDFGGPNHQYFVTKINGISSHQISDADVASGIMRLSDFYMTPGLYSVDFKIRQRGISEPMSIDATPILNRGKLVGSYTREHIPAGISGAIFAGTATIVVSPMQAGKTMGYFELLNSAGVIPLQKNSP